MSTPPPDGPQFTPSPGPQDDAPTPPPGAYPPPQSAYPPPPSAYPPPHAQGGYPPNVGVTPQDEQMWAVLSHVGALLVGFLAPLIIWLIYRDRSPYVRHHSAEALNFWITCLIGYVVSFVLIFVVIGILTFAAIGIAHLVFGILAAVAASRGEWYRYPLTLRLIR